MKPSSPVSVIFGNKAAREVERAAGDVRVDIDAAGEDDHAGGVNDATAIDVGNDLAVVDADVLDDAVDIVGGIVDFAAGDAKHGKCEPLKPFGSQSVPFHLQECRPDLTELVDLRRSDRSRRSLEGQRKRLFQQQLRYRRNP